MLLSMVYDRIEKNARISALSQHSKDFKAIYDGRMALYQDLPNLVVTVDNRTPESSKVYQMYVGYLGP